MAAARHSSLASQYSRLQKVEYGFRVIYADFLSFFSFEINSNCLASTQAVPRISAKALGAGGNSVHTDMTWKPPRGGQAPQSLDPRELVACGESLMLEANPIDLWLMCGPKQLPISF